MKMAKASEAEIHAVIDLAKVVESVCHPRRFEMPRFPDTDDDEGKPFDDTNLSDLRAFYLLVKEYSEGLQRVAFGYSVMFDNACDPSQDTLEFKPEITRAMDSHRALVEALQHAKKLLKTIHGNEAWEIFDEHSPDMKPINAALKLAEGKVQ